MSIWHIRKASRVVEQGGVIAYPTESVYGLGCCPWEIQAVARILTLKRRQPDKGLIVVAATVKQLEPLIELTDDVPVESVLASWPGPVTWVLPARKAVPIWLRGSQGGIAVRVTSHPIVKKLCQSVGLLVSTSANPEGYLPAKNPARVRAYFGNQINYILTGPTGGRAQTTEIRHAITGELIRTGQDISPGFRSQ